MKKIFIMAIFSLLMTMGMSQNIVADELEEIEETEETLEYDAPDDIKYIKAESSTAGAKITWAEDCVDGYYIYRSDKKNGTYKKVARTEYEVYTDKKAEYGKIYYYYVMAFYEYEDGHKEYSNKSDTVSAKKMLKRPVLKPAKRTYAKQIELSWSKVKDASKYVLYRSETRYGTYKRIATTRANRFVNKVSADKTYFYRVKSIASNNAQSDFSNEMKVASAITPVDDKLYYVDVSKQKYTYSEMVRDIKQLKKKYPKYFSYRIAGKTYDGRRLILIRIGNKNADNQIYVQSTIHAREYMNTMVTMSEFEFYLNNWNTMYDGKRTYGDLFNDTCVYYLPMMNPDGVSISQFGPYAIRDKKLRDNILRMGVTDYSRWKSNARGVDLNRNFQSYWSRVGKPGPDFFSGYSPNSERETKIIMKIINTHKFDYILTYHSMGGEVFYDIGQTGDIYNKTYLLASKVCQYTSYGLGSKSKPEGLSYNWTILDKKIPELIIETGVVRCPLPLWTYKDIKRQNHKLVAWMISQKLAQKVK